MADAISFSHLSLAPSSLDPYEDQFEKAAQAKKDRIAKNEKNRLRNVARASGKKPAAAAATPAAAPAPANKEVAKKAIEKQILATKVRTLVLVTAGHLMCGNREIGERYLLPLSMGRGLYRLLA